MIFPSLRIAMILILLAYHHVSMQATCKQKTLIMPVFRDFLPFFKLVLTLNKLPRKAGMSMPSTPCLCQEPFVGLENVLGICGLDTIHVGMVVCELKIFHHTQSHSISIVWWWDDRCIKSWSQPINPWYWKGLSAFPFATSRDSYSR